MQGDVSVLPPNLDLMATASNHSKKLRHETSFFRCFTQNHVLRNLDLWKELSGICRSSLWSTARTDLLYVKAKQMETKTAILTNRACRSPCMN